MIAQVLSFQKHGKLSVVQIATARQNTIEYISFGNAIKGGQLEIKEVNEAGRVNSLLVFNNSPNFVFMMDGDILSGAKQNRVLNTSIFLAPASKTVVPVSCVEQGRWRRVSPNFAGTDYTAPSTLRARKASDIRTHLAAELGFTSDQQKVWNHVVLFQKEAGVRSETSNLSDVYEEKRAEFSRALAGFDCRPDANGMALFLGKRLLSIDLFNRTDLFQEYFPKLLRGGAMEFFSVKDDTAEIPEPEASFRTLDILDRIAEVEGEKFPGVGVGTEKRFEVKGMNGFELDYEQHLIHAAALWPGRVENEGAA